EPLGDRWRRWSRRHRTLLTAVTMLLLAGVIGLGIGLWAVDRQRDKADQARRQAYEQWGAAEEARKRGNSEKERANSEKERAEQHAARAEAALTEAKENLAQADRNLLLARKAVDDCFVLAIGDVGMSQEAAAPFRRRLLAAAQPYYKEFHNRKPNDPASDLDL